MHRVLVSDTLSEHGLAILRSARGIEVDDHLGAVTNGRAVSVWVLDRAIPAQVIDLVRASPNVDSALALQV